MKGKTTMLIVSSDIRDELRVIAAKKRITLRLLVEDSLKKTIEKERKRHQGADQ